ncbi:DUF1036 domain-containing protein [Streptomyces syringium]|uniref:DUF1036 domain-containing protein n=1 Tax=Streptomyces syringium TaxID=76729 RepID=UPI00365F6860
MSLIFCNRYRSLVSVCYIKRHPPCPDGWLKRGWWNVAPGQCVTVDGANVSAVNRFWYFYAEAVDAVWTGPFGPYCVTNQAFEWCLNRCDATSTTRRVGFREIDVNGFSTFTVNLTA